MFKHILVGMDCYAQSHYPFKDALALAKATGADLKVVHVFSFDEQCELWWLSAFRAEHPDYTFLDYLLERWQTFLHEQKTALGQCQAEAAAAGVATVLDLEPYSGRPGAVVCEVARTWPADLIVVGHRDKWQEKFWQLGELRLGSVSEHVLYHAPCSVLIDHQPVEALNTAGRLTELHRILVAVDVSETSQMVFEAALNLAKGAGASLTLLHVESSFEGDRPQELLKSFAHDARMAGVPFQSESRHGEFGGTVGHDICSIAKTANVDLIVMGRRGLSGLQERLLGSVSHYVAYHAPCAVLMVQSTRAAQSVTAYGACQTSAESHASAAAQPLPSQG